MMKKLTIFLVMIMFMMVGAVSATTLEEGAIIAAANRLVETQNNDGTWEWSNPDTNKTYNDDERTVCNSNIVGVTARGLVDAYQLTGTTSYLDAAEISGNAIVACGYTDPTDKYYSQDIEFLVELGEATGDSIYTDKAVAIMEYFMTQDNRYCPTGGDGCTAVELAAFYENHYSVANNNNYYPGMTEWQLASWVRAAQVTGKTSWADDMITEINVDISGDTPYFDINNLSDYGVIGLAGIVDVTGDAVAKQKLIDLQEADGRWGTPNGVVQDTAYAVMALLKVEEITSANWGKNWLVNNQYANGGWIESDSKEYTEVDSEALQAIFDVMAVSNVGGVGSDFVALTVPDYIDYGRLYGIPGFDSANFVGVKTVPLENTGSLNIVVTATWESGAEVFKYIKFSDVETSEYDKITDGVGAEADYVSVINAVLTGNQFSNIMNIFSKIVLGTADLRPLVGPQTGTIYFSAVESPMVTGVSFGRDSWATAECWRSGSNDAGIPYEMRPCFPEGAYENGTEIHDWDASDWETGPLDLVSGAPITLYLMSENIADVKIYGHEEIRVANPNGVTCLDFVSSCRFDGNIYGDNGYGKQHTDCNSLLDDEGEIACHNVNDNLIELWSAYDTSSWDAESTEVSQWVITFDGSATGTYTLTYRIIPEV